MATSFQTQGVVVLNNNRLPGRASTLDTYSDKNHASCGDTPSCKNLKIIDKALLQRSFSIIPATGPNDLNQTAPGAQRAPGPTEIAMANLDLTATTSHLDTTYLT